MDFSSYYYRVAIGYPTNCLRDWYFHSIHRIASSVPGVFLYSLAFVVVRRMGMTDKRTLDTQGEKQMWYPTLQAVIGNLYVLSHFYNMYVVTPTYSCSKHAYHLVVGFTAMLALCLLSKSNHRRTYLRSRRLRSMGRAPPYSTPPKSTHWNPTPIISDVHTVSSDEASASRCTYIPTYI